MAMEIENFQTRVNVIDVSEGANYGGGSSYPGGTPLLPSTVGLAGLPVNSRIALLQQERDKLLVIAAKAKNATNKTRALELIKHIDAILKNLQSSNVEFINIPVVQEYPVFVGGYGGRGRRHHHHHHRGRRP